MHIVPPEGDVLRGTEPFLRAIIEEPDEDTHRLVFADWLEEHGRAPRAEFIRVQVELACLPPDHPRRSALLSREKDLLTEYGERWAAPLWSLVSEWVYRRGFIEVVEIGPVCSVATHLLKDLVTGAPVRHVRFYEFVNRPRLAEALEHLAGVSTLEIEAVQIKNNKDRQALREILTSPHLSRLTTLHVLGDGSENGRIDNKTAELAFNSPHLSNLRELALYEWTEGMMDPHVRALAKSPHLPRLESLDLRDAYLAPAVWRALAKSPHRSALRKLCLNRARVTGQHFGPLQGSGAIHETLEARFGADGLDFDSEHTCWEGQKWTQRALVSDTGY